METQADIPGYRIWGANKQAQEPMELPALVAAIKQRRVLANTWLYLDHENAWRTAGEVPELKMFFAPKTPAAAPGATAGADDPGIKTGSLRRIKILADLDEEQLEVFLRYMQVQRHKQFTQIVRQGDHGDAMYLILEGELRARVMIDGRESTLATLTPGDFFGEISLLDEGPRSADVVANKDSVLLKISAEAFQHLRTQAPELALPFLNSLSRTLVSRMRQLTKRYQDSIHFSRTAAST